MFYMCFSPNIKKNKIKANPKYDENTMIKDDFF